MTSSTSMNDDYFLDLVWRFADGIHLTAGDPNDDNIWYLLRISEEGQYTVVKFDRKTSRPIEEIPIKFATGRKLLAWALSDIMEYYYGA